MANETGACFFDFDGVVLDSSGLKHRLFVEIAGAHAVALARGLDAALNGDLVGAERSRVGAWVEQASGGALPASVFTARFAERLSTELPRIGFTAGFQDFMAACRSRAIPLAIVSNAPTEDIEAALTARAVRPDLFFAIRGFEPAGKTAVAADLVRSLGVAPGSVTFFGDMPSDLAVAKAVGMRFVRVRSAAGELCLWPADEFPIHGDFRDLARGLAP